jgi:hypothetical protein
LYQFVVPPENIVIARAGDEKKRLVGAIVE